MTRFKYLTKTHPLIPLSGLLMCCICTIAVAHNKVVVIPMAGDDVPAELTPTTPIAKVDPSQSDYTIGAFTVIDNITGLEWQRQNDDEQRTFDEAWDECANLELDSHSDWRLPRVKELQSIVDYGSATAPTIDQVAFPNTFSSSYWSASSVAGGSGGAWDVYFYDGFVGSLNKTARLYVRCVR